MRELTLVLPGWDLPSEYLAFSAGLPQWAVPTLDIWRRAATRRQVDFHQGDLIAHTFSGSLKAKILQDLDLPAATPCFLAAPVSQHMDMHSMQLLSGSDLQLSWTEAHGLCNALNALLTENDWQCHVYRPDLWLVTYPQVLDWYAPDVWALGSRADASSKITGNDAAQMLKMLTEMQMLLFAQSSTAPRAASALPPVNGVWLWPDTVGCAVPESAAIGQVPWLPEQENICCSDELSWSEIERLVAMHEQLTVYVNSAQQAADKMDLMAHAAFLQDFDQAVLAPAWQAMLAGSLRQIQVISTHTVLTLRAVHRLRFWRRAQPYLGRI